MLGETKEPWEFTGFPTQEDIEKAYAPRQEKEPMSEAEAKRLMKEIWQRIQHESRN